MHVNKYLKMYLDSKRKMQLDENVLFKFDKCLETFLLCETILFI